MFYNGPSGAMTYFADRTYPGSVMNEMLVWMDDTGGTGADAATEFLIFSRRYMEGMGGC